MLTHPTLAIPPLVEPRDLDGDLPPSVRTSRTAMKTTLDWARSYLCRPHPDLGRKGSVCPFAEGSLSRQTFYLAVCENTPADAEQIAATVGHYRDWFLELPPTTEPAAQFKAILVLFPALTGELRQVIDTAQRWLKPAYVSSGLMIGEFHDAPPDKGGLWNAEFRPLRSPVPLLAIRHMVATDFPFLASDEEHIRAYLDLFGDRVPQSLRPRVDRAIARLQRNAP